MRTHAESAEYGIAVLKMKALEEIAEWGSSPEIRERARQELASVLKEQMSIAMLEDPLIGVDDPPAMNDEDAMEFLNVSSLELEQIVNAGVLHVICAGETRMFPTIGLYNYVLRRINEILSPGSIAKVGEWLASRGLLTEEWECHRRDFK